MRNPTSYLKMRVLGAIDMATGTSIQARIQAVSQMTFTDEDGYPRRFTWRTIQTWYTRYHKHGATCLENKPRSDKGKTRKVRPEELLEAIRAALPKLHGQFPKRTLLYRVCLEEGLLTRSQIAPNTFSRLVKELELLKPDSEVCSKIRLAFAKAHANDLWQADTLVGPYVQHEGASVQTRLIAFLDDASRVCAHGQFFPAENVDTLIEALRRPSINGAFPRRSMSTMAPFTAPRKSSRFAPGWVASCITRPSGMEPPREKSSAFSAVCASSSWPAPWTWVRWKRSTASSPNGPRNSITPRNIPSWK